MDADKFVFNLHFLAREAYHDNLKIDFIKTIQDAFVDFNGVKEDAAIKAIQKELRETQQFEDPTTDENHLEKRIFRQVKQGFNHFLYGDGSEGNPAFQ